jgi:HK97 family phage major capsid protein
VPSQGGFLVPEVLRSDILQMMIEKSIVRRFARIVPMDSLRIPYPTIDDTTHTSSVLGGVIGYWAEEAAALTASQPAFARTELEAHKLTCYTEVPNELLNDAVQALAAWMQDVLPTALAFYEDLAFISGSGVGQPQGILNAPAALQVTRGTAGKVLFADLAQMYSQLLPQSHRSPSTVWLCSPDVLPQLLQLVVAAPVTTSGTAAVAPPVWLGGMSAAGDRPTEILGHPLFVTEKVPALGTTGDVILADLSFYLLGDRMELTATSSAHYKFSSDITAFRWIERVDGRCWLQSALTLENGSANKVSPIVVLH